jgi:hypothetical protein
MTGIPAAAAADRQNPTAGNQIVGRIYTVVQTRTCRPGELPVLNRWLWAVRLLRAETLFQHVTEADEAHMRAAGAAR